MKITLSEIVRHPDGSVDVVWGRFRQCYQSLDYLRARVEDECRCFEALSWLILQGVLKKDPELSERHAETLDTNTVMVT